MQQDLEMCGSILLQDFEMLKVLGQGTFGTVALARSTTSDGHEVCAIKMLSKDFIIKNKLVDSVKSERAVLAKVDHDSIVKMHFAFQTSRMVYFVMEYCCGGELFFHFRQKSRRIWKQVPTIRFYAAEIIHALEYLHDDLDVIYRDLKPENVLLDADGHVKLADMGLAKYLAGEKLVLSQGAGTREYMAPEMFSSVGHGKPVDWWALGILVYEMFSA